MKLLNVRSALFLSRHETLNQCWTAVYEASPVLINRIGRWVTACYILTFKLYNTSQYNFRIVVEGLEKSVSEKCHWNWLTIDWKSSGNHSPRLMCLWYVVVLFVLAAGDQVRHMPGLAFWKRLTHILDMGLVEMAISTNRMSKIWVSIFAGTAPDDTCRRRRGGGQIQVCVYKSDPSSWCLAPRLS